MKRTNTRAHRWIIYLLLIVGGTTGIAVLFLPFTYHTAPMDVVVDVVRKVSAGEVRAWIRDGGRQFVALAAPFFLTVLVSGAATRWIISGSFTRAEKTIVYFAAAAGACLTLWIYLLILEDWQRPSNLQEWLLVMVPPMTLLLGGYGVMRSLRWGAHSDLSALISLEVAYLGNCLLCLVLFLREWQSGAYCALVTAVVYLLHVILISAQRRTPKITEEMEA